MKGEKKGRQEATRQMTKILKEDGVPLDAIIKSSGLTKEEIPAL